MIEGFQYFIATPGGAFLVTIAAGLACRGRCPR
jgi:hypothetical protein